MQRIVLTSKETRVLVFIVSCFFLGLATKSYRASHPATPLTDKKSHQAAAAAGHRKH
jgi:hypothetical protein